MPHMKLWRDLWENSDLSQKRIAHLSDVITKVNTQFIPKIHDRLTVSERQLKKFNRMLALWECGELVEQKVVEKIVEVPVAGNAEPQQRKKQKPLKMVDYATYQYVMRMLDSGMSAYRISKELGFSQQTISNIRHMSPERVDKLRQLYERGEQVRSCSVPAPLDGNTLKKILEEQKRTPGIPLARLSALTGVSIYYIKKYLALSDAERAALLGTVGVDAPSDVVTTQSQTRKPRKGDDLNDPLFLADDDDL
ncbi:hypothetical protein F9643_003169 [Escherichia coli]|uniref:hypothetical protein n=1 Tax=Escherichia coli TaxID=562 RepID=UPI000BDED33B|nr:hypothetical protein [Escherichia coli]EER0916726.1 hypothetical protein [Escherichia coli O168:H8]EES8553815.1 hypothetical protein [Escherichia coli O168]EER0947496.1 hypothetical protein [Escherichia coli O168:H8]EER2485493.1 hypothetical protein [Escherichia coli]EER2541207.1 hypothetical protein [Escherichia coli]